MTLTNINFGNSTCKTILPEFDSLSSDLKTFENGISQISADSHVVVQQSGRKQLDTTYFEGYLNYNADPSKVTIIDSNLAIRTDYIPLDQSFDVNYKVSIQYASKVVYALFDENKNCIYAKPASGAGTGIFVTFEENLTYDNITASYPNAKYIMFNCFRKWLIVNQRNGDKSISVRETYEELQDVKDAIKTDIKQVDNFEQFEYSKINGKYIDRNGKIGTASEYSIIENLPIERGLKYRFTVNTPGSSQSKYIYSTKNGILQYTYPSTNTGLSTITLDCNDILDVYGAAYYLTIGGTYVSALRDKDEPKLNAAVKSIREQQISDEEELKKISYSTGEYVVQEYPTELGYIEHRDGSRNTYEKAKHTDFIEIASSDKFSYSSNARQNSCGFALYTESKAFIKSYDYNATGTFRIIDRKIDCAELLEENPSAKYIMFSMIESSDPAMYKADLIVKKFEKFSNDSAYENLLKKIGECNILNGKKYVACGDSFTASEDESVVEPYDYWLQLPKTYPWFIGTRNSMDVKNIARSGAAMSWDKHSPESNARTHFVEKYLTYKNELSTADYITFMFGLNEQKGSKALSSYYKEAESQTDPTRREQQMNVYLSTLISEPETYYLSDYFMSNYQVKDIMSYDDLSSCVFSGTTYGTVEDSEISTVCGAWNTVLSAIYTWNPTVKIGIILTQGGLSEAQRTTQKQIAEWWGIPVLDLDADKSITLMQSGKTDSNINPWIKQLKNTIFSKSPTDMHPSFECHQFESTVIEDFLRHL